VGPLRLYSLSLPKPSFGRDPRRRVVPLNGITIIRCDSVRIPHGTSESAPSSDALEAHVWISLDSTFSGAWETHREDVSPSLKEGSSSLGGVSLGPASSPNEPRRDNEMGAVPSPGSPLTRRFETVRPPRCPLFFPHGRGGNRPGLLLDCGVSISSARRIQKGEEGVEARFDLKKRAPGNTAGYFVR
jgi:hypothetical protein